MLADNLKKARNKKGYSKLELGRRSGVTSRTIENIEHRKNENPTVDTLNKLAKALEVNLNDLIQ